MIAINESTAPTAMISAARIATLNGASSTAAPGAAVPTVRPMITKMITGITRLPTSPSGSRTKTFVSTQVSFQNPRSMVSPGSRGR